MSENFNDLLQNVDPDTNFFDSYPNEENTSECSNYISIADYNETCETENQYLTIICYNIRSFHSNHDSFFAALQSDSSYPEVLVFCETWFSEDNLVNIPNYNSFHTFRPDNRGGGVSVYVRDTLFSTCIIDLSFQNPTIETCSVQLTINRIKYYIIGIYRPHSDSVPNFIEALTLILNNPIIKDKNCILLGDLNINILNETQTNNDFVNLLHSLSFLPCITKPTRFPNIDGHRPSLLDHIWINKLCMFKSGILLHDFTDHLPVFLKLPILSNKPNREEKIKISFRLDNDESRSRFNEKIQNFNWDSLLSESVDDSLENFCNKLNSLYRETFPLKHKLISNKKALNPWCTPSIQHIINLKSKFFELLKLGLVTKEENNNFKNKIKKIIDKCKTNFYKREFMRVRGDLRKTWDFIHSLTSTKNYKIISQITSNGQEITSPEIISEIFNDYFNNIALNLASNIPTTDLNPLHYVPFNENSFFMRPVSNNECIVIIENLKNTKSDFNTFPVYLLKIFRYILAPIICKLVNLSFTNGIFPSSLKSSIIVPIHKKGDSTILNNYRPISLLPTFSKIFERCIFNRLLNFIDRYSLLETNQFGFRKKKSTEDAILDLTNKIYQSLNNKEYSIGVFIDYSKAFDTIDHQILLKKLEKYGVRGIPLQLFRSYLSNRKHKTKIQDNLSSSKSINIGLPQGSILSPLIFILYINDLNYVSNSFEKVLFADDTALTFTNKNFNSLIQTCNIELEKFNKWSIANKLSINTDKTYCMLFTNRQVPNLLPPIYLNNKIIKYQNTVRYLGLMLDNRLKFDIHIETISKKISKSTGIFYKLRSITGGECLNILYHSLVSPYLSYCSLIWGKAYPTHLKCLETLQKRCIRIINNKPFREHTRPLFYSSKILKIEDSYNLRLGSYMYRLPNFEQFQSNHHHETRNRNNLRPEFQRLSLGQQSISYQGPKLWNSIPPEIKTSSSYYKFKKQYKKFLLSKYIEINENV